MIDEITETILSKMLDVSIIDMQTVREAREIIVFELGQYEITKKSKALVVHDLSTVGSVGKFLIAKATKGLSGKTLTYYRIVLSKALPLIGKKIDEITTDDLRGYLTRRRLDGCSNVTLNNERRALSSFFSWATIEEMIPKNPMLRIEKIKEKNRTRQPFTEDELERLRNAASGIREKAILEFFYSTGCRVTEVSQVDIDDIDFVNRELIVTGKGNKERKVYLTPKCVLLLKDYLETRSDPNPALFVSELRPHDRINTSGFEIIIRKIGHKAGITNVHPHRIRHTTATIALRRGMPLDQVSKMLGHEDLRTTTIYAKTSDDDLKQNHKKYIS